ncbi:MAG: nitrous oxide reductase accessory protein NosL [Thermoanaerobaculaceae bacterium]|nr:nitrous oxide reductase accessory protein NosL [Thermoanaerobaculaceae bacterium]
MRRASLAVLLVAMLASCGRGPVAPAPLDTRNESCAWCRMSVSDPRFAAQLVAPREEPKFFDDIGCLRDHLAATKEVPRGAVAYVVDHRSRTWVPAGAAVYTEVASLETPMGSHLIAHANETSRTQDPDARTGKPLTAANVFGPAGVPRSEP